MKQGTAIIIGAGPAGLTAALELQRRSAIQAIVLEAGHAVGGLARTVRYKGNRIDLGGHRFFSKSDRVMQWWLELLPLELPPLDAEAAAGCLRYHGADHPIPAPAPSPAPHSHDLVMLVRPRRSRIYFLRRFFDYPLRLTPSTLRQLGPARALACAFSYLFSVVFPRRPERSLEDFLINRFGRRLYRTFFQSYTEKVWGAPCRAIGAEWGAQRIKGLSLKSVAVHFLKQSLARPGGSIAQKRTQTSLIEQFLYPKLGAGQLWERAAELVRAGGGQIHCGVAVDRIHVADGRVISVEGVDRAGARISFSGDVFFSSMPVPDLIRALDGPVPRPVREAADGLLYRNLIVVALLVATLAVTEDDGSPLRDNWIYIHEPGVRMGRLQIFNNWSPSLVENPQKTWIGLEYFCNESDDLWRLSDREMTRLAIAEAARIGILHPEDVEDSHVVRVPKAYPAYLGSYDRFGLIRAFTDRLENLYLVGRNGMHKYNNQDHSMLTAMTAVDNLLNGVAGKENIWAINTESDYQEERPHHSGGSDSARTSPPH